MKYYVTTYKCYPIYEPAEGGYYYEGVEVNSIDEFDDLESAMGCINQEVVDNDLIQVSDTKWVDEDYKRGKYIGVGWYIRLETDENKGEEVQSWQPYQ